MKSFLLHLISFVFLSASINAQSIVDIVVGSPDHNTLEAAVIAADLAGTLSSPGPFTVFAPTDAAFAAIGQDAIDALLADPGGDLTNILLHHVVAGVANGDNIFDGMKVASQFGQNLEFVATPMGLTINGANVTVANLKADNGVVHVIDAVLLPEVKAASVVDIIVNSPNHNTLEAAVLAAGLEGALAGPDYFTVFAPTDAAFDAVGADAINELLADPQGALTDILSYHVVRGVASSGYVMDGVRVSTLLGPNLSFSSSNGARVNDAMITVVDLEAENGVVHVIDAVLLPETKPVLPSSVVDIIVNSPDHNTLETAVLAAGLQDALSAPGFITVFAPTDAAFAAVDPAVLNSLLADPQGALTDVLTYHVVSGELASGAITEGLKVGTLSGPNLEFSTQGGATVNGANIIVTDIRSQNGVVHVIDAVLVP